MPLFYLPNIACHFHRYSRTHVTISWVGYVNTTNKPTANYNPQLSVEIMDMCLWKPLAELDCVNFRLWILKANPLFLTKPSANLSKHLRKKPNSFTKNYAHSGCSYITKIFKSNPIHSARDLSPKADSCSDNHSCMELLQGGSNMTGTICV